MARRCSCTGVGSQSGNCIRETAACVQAEEEEMTMCHHGSSVSDNASCSTGRQLCQTNQILDSINDILAQILLELQRQNGAGQR